MSGYLIEFPGPRPVTVEREMSGKRDFMTGEELYAWNIATVPEPGIVIHVDNPLTVESARRFAQAILRVTEKLR